jgi:hypothetical protein
MNDREFIAAFEACEIANSEFHHADHIRLAWLYLREFALLDAIERFTASLRRFAAHHGKAERYHETVTWAYMLLIHERMVERSSFEDFRAANPDLFSWKPSILEGYYRADTFASERARQTFVMPDRNLEGLAVRRSRSE